MNDATNCMFFCLLIKSLTGFSKWESVVVCVELMVAYLTEPLLMRLMSSQYGAITSRCDSGKVVGLGEVYELTKLMSPLLLI